MRGRAAARPGGGRSLHLTGHVDVVPVESEERWTHDPWGGEIAEGRMWGRGAGDMKAGIAAYLVAVEALQATGAELRGDVLFTSVIEEECGGNGMRAVLQAGYTADGTLIGEPTDLRVHVNGVGVIWARLTARSEGAHAAYASEHPGPVDQIMPAVQGLRALEEALNDETSRPSVQPQPGRDPRRRRGRRPCRPRSSCAAGSASGRSSSRRMPRRC